MGPLLSPRGEEERSAWSNAIALPRLRGRVGWGMRTPRPIHRLGAKPRLPPPPAPPPRRGGGGGGAPPPPYLYPGGPPLLAPPRGNTRWGRRGGERAKGGT